MIIQLHPVQRWLPLQRPNVTDRRCPGVLESNQGEIRAVKDINKKDIDKIFAEGTPIDRALTRAARAALRQHKVNGLPVVEWRDGRCCLDPT